MLIKKEAPNLNNRCCQVAIENNNRILHFKSESDLCAALFHSWKICYVKL